MFGCGQFPCFGCTPCDAWTVRNAASWRVVEWGIAHQDLSSITSIGIDEIQYRRGHKYLTLVSAEAEGQSDEEADCKTPRVAEVQPDEREGLPDAGRLQSLLDVHVGDVGRQISA